MDFLDKEEYSYVLSQVSRIITIKLKAEDPTFYNELLNKKATGATNLVAFTAHRLCHFMICLNPPDAGLNDTMSLEFITFGQLDTSDQREIIEDVTRELNINIKDGEC